MDKTVEEREAIWQNFLRRWPLEKLDSMTLADYTSVDTGGSFCNWLEKHTEDIGSIWGGSSFKFGVYARKDTSNKEDGRGRRFTDYFAWMEKYGETPESAFEAVRSEISKVANAAAHDDLPIIDSANLGEALRWKIAFLYQNRSTPSVLPIFKGEYLNLLLDTPESNLSTVHRRLMAERSDLPLLKYGDILWGKVQQALHEQANPLKAQAYLDASASYRLLKEPTDKIAGYESETGKQIALSLKSKKPVLYVSPGQWLDLLPNSITGIKHYEASQSRNSNLAANAPNLKLGNPMVAVTVSTMDELSQVCDLYADALISNKPKNNSDVTFMESSSSQTQQALNTILFGPPGTGKTFATSELAVKIAEPTEFDAIYSNLSGTERRAAMKALYDKLVSDKRVAFTTFHQSFSYEDFIEGIRAKPASDDGGLVYTVEDGVFKEIANRADKTVSGEQGLGLAATPTIWKISIGRKHDKEMRQRYIDAGEVRVGWNATGDLSQDYDDRSTDEQHYWDSLSPKNHSALTGFSQDMKIGDVLLCLKDSETIQAIGIVTSDYSFDEKVGAGEERGYAHVRKVNWLFTDIAFNILPVNNQKKMVQQTLYPLSRISWNDLAVELERQGVSLPTISYSTRSETTKPNYVLIIDEINRGNIARIFGELITLLEPDKRKGGSDQRSAILPYSKDPFSVPSNLYVIGTMNTADKSLAQLDLALRRRFEFTEVMPDYSLLNGIEVHGVAISNLLETINSRVEVLLDRDHVIGHSYFLPLKSNRIDHASVLASIFKNKIIPLLQEYFFSDWEKIGWILNDIDKVWEHRFIQLKHEQSQLGALFSKKVSGDLQDRRYQINSNAFVTPESYQGILVSTEL